MVKIWTRSCAMRKLIGFHIILLTMPFCESVASLSSSTFLSRNLLHFLIRCNLSKLKGWNIMSPRLHTCDMATNESPAANSLLPISIFAFSNVSPWLLWTVIAQTRQTGTCSCEHDVPFLPSQIVLLVQLEILLYHLELSLLVQSHVTS